MHPFVYLQQLTFAKARISADQHMDVASGGYAILAASIFLHTAKQGEQQTRLDELVAIDSRTERMTKVAEL